VGPDDTLDALIGDLARLRDDWQRLSSVESTIEELHAKLSDLYRGAPHMGGIIDSVIRAHNTDAPRRELRLPLVRASARTS